MKRRDGVFVRDSFHVVSTCRRHPVFPGASMSVNHCLLPVTEEELALLLETPEQIREFVEARQADVCFLLTDGCAIVAITAEGDDDPLAFIRTGTSSGDGGWVG